MASSPLIGKRVLLVIGGGIAAYKCLDLIRRLKERGLQVRCILTAGGAEFVTPLAVSSLSGEKVYTDLFSLTDEAEMGHIRLSREADIVLVAPATADLMAKMANGLANDLASTALLATDKPVYIAPSMNSQMWHHPATQRNLKTLEGDGIVIISPAAGDLACGEVGTGRLADNEDILQVIETALKHSPPTEDLKGQKILVTAGPTHEPLDPVRYLANRSSGKQGYALAQALAARGADVILVSGPTALATPAGVTRVDVQTALEMKAACAAALPVDAAICVAAVADWRPDNIAGQKIKKGSAGRPALSLVENPDILAWLSGDVAPRPRLVVGFAAETESLNGHAADKLARKGCDWIIANDVSGQGEQAVMGGDHNQITLISAAGEEAWPRSSKTDIAQRLAARIAEHLTSAS